MARGAGANRQPLGAGLEHASRGRFDGVYNCRGSSQDSRAARRPGRVAPTRSEGFQWGKEESRRGTRRFAGGRLQEHGIHVSATRGSPRARQPFLSTFRRSDGERQTATRAVARAQIVVNGVRVNLFARISIPPGASRPQMLSAGMAANF